MDISKEDKKFLKRICNNSNISANEKFSILTEHFSKDTNEIKEILDFLEMSIVDSQFAAAKLHILKKKKRYIISSAQNASPIHLEFVRNIEAYAKHINAEIGIIATRYKNPTSIWKEEGDVWDSRISQYLTAKRQYLHKNLLLLADLKIQATSPYPTNGLESFGDGASCIVGSPRMEERPVPVLPESNQKFLWATGSVTLPSFTDSVAGGKAEEHHTFGFLVVEIENDEVVHVRNVSANADGSFNDLIFRVEKETVSSEEVEILTWGDSHFAQKKQEVTDAFRGLCSDLGITCSVLHDIWDSKSLNVHNANNPVEQYKLKKSGKDDLEVELEEMFNELNWFEKNMKSTIVVASNHDDMLDRAMYQSDWKDHINNALIFVRMLELVLSGKAKNGIIPYYINNEYNNITALGINDSYIKYGIELGLHGHKGPNGTRGNINSFSKLSTKTNIGHRHAPMIRWGCYCAGISCQMDHGYNNGLSDWAYAGITVNKYGKRQMIIFNKDTLTYTTLI